MLTEAEIDQALEKLEQEYRSDRDALLRMKQMMSRDILSHPPDIDASVSPNKKAFVQPKKKATPVKRVVRTKSNRDIVKNAIVRSGKPFTVTELMAAAKNSGDAEAASLPSSVWSSTLSYLNKNGVLEVVKKSFGNNPAIYRLAISEEELLAPLKRGGEQPSPLQDAVKWGISHMPLIVFERKDLFDFLVSQQPEFAERYKLDSVGAVLNRLANNEDEVRIIERKSTGNTYEKIL